MRKLMTFLVVCIATAILAGVVPAASAQAADGEPVRVAQNDGPSLAEAVEQVRRRYNGRIVSAETQVRGNREVHVIKVLTDDGKVKTVRINGRSRGSRG